MCVRLVRPHSPVWPLLNRRRPQLGGPAPCTQLSGLHSSLSIFGRRFNTMNLMVEILKTAGTVRTLAPTLNTLSNVHVHVECRARVVETKIQPPRTAFLCRVLLSSTFVSDFSGCDCHRVAFTSSSIINRPLPAEEQLYKLSSATFLDGWSGACAV